MTSKTPRDHNSNPRTRLFFLSLLLLTALALVLRAVVSLELYSHVSVQAPLTVTDMATYRRLAAEIAGGRWPDFYYYQPFYYAVFLPLIFRLFGVGALGVVLMQAALSTATVYLCGLAGAHLFGRRAGLVAAALLALAAFPIFYVPFCLLATLQAFWMALLLALATSCWRHDRTWQWAVLGLVLSAAILTRGNALLLLPAVLGLLLWRRRTHLRRALAPTLLLLVLVYLPQLPFSLRNAAHYGRWTGPSSAQDAVLALGNTPEAPPGGLEYPASYHAWVDRASLPPPERVPVSRQMLRYAISAPLEFAELKFRAMLLFWHRMEIPNNISINREGRASILLPWLLPFGLIGSLGLFGLVTCGWRRSPPRLFLVAAVAAYWLGTALFYILARFRVPAVPLLCVCAGGGVQRLVLLLRSRLPAERRRQRLLLLLLAAVAAAFVVLDGFSFYQRQVEPAAMRLLRPNGICVNTDNRLIQYDRGPLGIGGIQFLEVPPDGLVLEKRFAPQTSPPDWLQQADASFRLPVRLTPGTRLGFQLIHGNRAYGSDTLEVVSENGIQWLTVRLGALTPLQAVEPFQLHLSARGGELHIAVDTLRQYGRTRFRNSRGQEVAPDWEAAAELRWERRQSDP